MTAQGQLQAAAKSASFDGRHHGLVGGLDVVNHRYEERPPNLCVKLLDVRPCCNGDADRRTNEHPFQPLAVGESLLCYVKQPSHCVTNKCLKNVSVGEYSIASVDLCLCACMIFLLYLATACICLARLNQSRSFGLGLNKNCPLAPSPPRFHLSRINNNILNRTSVIPFLPCKLAVLERFLHVRQY